MTAGRPTVAVIGSGVAGLTAAHLLQRTYDVTLLEADDRLGGHTHTHDLVDPAGARVAVDSGFIVHNDRTYPLLRRLFTELGIETRQTEMSLSVRCDGCGLEFAGGRGAAGMFPCGVRSVRAPYLRLLAEIPRFHRRARALLAQADSQPDAVGPTFGEFLAHNRFSSYFVEHFAQAVVACVWSSGRATAMNYPAVYLFRFLDNHGQLSITGSPRWSTVLGGSEIYVRKIAAGLSGVHTGAPVSVVRRHDDAVEVREASGVVHEVDRVVLATHADRTLALLADASPLEKKCSALSRTPSTTQSCIPIPRCCRPRPGLARPGTTGCAAAATPVRLLPTMRRCRSAMG